MNSRNKLFCTALVLVGFMIPAQAFNVSDWFSSLSPRSKGAVYVTAAALFAGVSYFTYKIWTKRLSHSRVQAPEAIVPLAPAPEPVVEPTVSQEAAPLSVAPAQPIADAQAKQQEEVKERAAQASSSANPGSQTRLASSLHLSGHGAQKRTALARQVTADKTADTEWQALKTFKLPEQIFSVAVGKDARCNVIILAGGMSCVYRIDTTTGVFTRLALPAPHLASYNGVVKETPERIDALKIVSHDQFIAQSRSHVRLCDMQGNIVEQIEDTSHCGFRTEGTCFDAIDVERDITGKFLVCVQKDHGKSITMEEAGSIRSMPFGNGRMLQMYRSNVLVKDKKGDLKVVIGGFGNGHIFYYDVQTGTTGERIPMKNGAISVINDEHAVVYMHDYIHMSSLKDGHRLYTMLTGTEKTSKASVLSRIVNAHGDYITADRGGAIKIWDLKNQACKTIAQLDIPVEEYWSASHRTVHPTFQSLDLSRRFLGNHHFVSAAKDGTVKLWARTKEAEEQEMDASIAKGFFEYLDMSQPNVQKIVRDYVGQDAEQALAEIQREKTEKEQGRLSRLCQMSKEAGLD